MDIPHYNRPNGDDLWQVRGERLWTLEHKAKEADKLERELERARACIARLRAERTVMLAEREKMMRHGNQVIRFLMQFYPGKHPACMFGWSMESQRDI